MPSLLGRPARRSLRDASVVITGAGSGIGRALAVAMAGAGARVGLLDLDPEGLADTAALLSPERVLVQRCDVCDPDQCRAAMAAVTRAWGGIDVLVNNAGISHRSRFAQTSPEVLRQVMEVNFFGAVNCTRAALPGLIERRGEIVVLSSVAGFAPLVGRTGYAASKHALHGFFASLRAELVDDGVGVLIVCPGFTRTAIDRHALAGDGAPAGEDKQTVGRVLAPEEVAAAIVGGLVRGDRLLVLSPVAKASYVLSRLAPALYERMMRARQSREFEP